MLDLKKLENKLDSALKKETNKSLNEWLNQKEMKKFSEFTRKDHTKLAQIVAKEIVAMQNKMIKDLMDEVMTPPWIKWYRKLKAKFTKKGTI